MEPRPDYRGADENEPSRWLSWIRVPSIAPSRPTERKADRIPDWVPFVGKRY